MNAAINRRDFNGMSRFLGGQRLGVKHLLPSTQYKNILIESSRSQKQLSSLSEKLGDVLDFLSWNLGWVHGSNLMCPYLRKGGVKTPTCWEWYLIPTTPVSWNPGGKKNGMSPCLGWCSHFSILYYCIFVFFQGQQYRYMNMNTPMLLSGVWVLTPCSIGFSAFPQKVLFCFLWLINQPPVTYPPEK